MPKILSCAFLAVALSASAARGDPLEATAVDSDVTSYDYGLRETVRLFVTEEKDRLAALYTNCRSRGGELELESCDRLHYLFPQFRVDGLAKVVTLGQEVVGTFDGPGGAVRLSPGYQIGLRKYSDTRDDGFQKTVVTHVAVFIDR